MKDNIDKLLRLAIDSYTTPREEFIEKIAGKLEENGFSEKEVVSQRIEEIIEQNKVPTLSEIIDMLSN